MPELPEVQTFINFLKLNIIDSKIVDIDVLNNKFLKNIDEKNFKKILKNNKFIDIKRIGKYLIFILSNNFKIVVHLRMEGKFYINETKINRKHDYIIFQLNNNKIMTYNDSRQFGTFHICKELNKLKEITKIAIDPLDNKFDFDYFSNKINKSNKSIKSILLDQTIVSGIGNIYASEIMFDSKINPFLKGKELTKNQIEKIITSSKRILKLALECGGTTIHTYKFGDNHFGEFTKYLKVVGRENKNCFNCKNKILRIKQQSRSTFYCPNCQK